MNQEVSANATNGSNGKMLGRWLAERCQEERLSLREAAARANLSHTTIADILNGARPSAETIKKLARAFADNGQRQRAVLEDLLLSFSGYRSNRPEAELSEQMARLIDKLSQFSDEQLEVMEHFADFIAKVK